MKIRLCGAAGRLGSRLVRELEGRHALVLGNVKPLGDPRSVSLDITDLAAVRAALRLARRRDRPWSLPQQAVGARMKRSRDHGY